MESSSEEESLPETNEQGLERESEGGGGEVKEGGVRGKGDVGKHLSAEDEGRVRNFVAEFVGQRLVPHLEAVLKNLNEWVGPSNHMTKIELPPHSVIHLLYGKHGFHELNVVLPRKNCLPGL